MQRGHFPQTSVYTFRFLIRPFLFVFAAILCSLVLPFWETGASFYSLILFGSLYALIFIVPFRFNDLSTRLSKQGNLPGAFHLKTWKLSCILLFAALFMAVTAFTAQSVTLQINNARLTGSIFFGVTGSLYLVSALFIGLFSFIFYFSEPATAA